MSDGWKTLRVVVEVPVRGDFNAKDLRWLVEQATYELERSIRTHREHPTTGRVRVLEFNRLVAAEARS